MARRDPILRTARVVYLLTKGTKLTTMQVAEMLDMSRVGAWQLMNRLAASHDVPVICVGGHWLIIGVTPTDPW